LEVHYRWHPYFGCKVVIRRIAQRATGRFLSILGPAGVVVTIADWMLDPIVCAAMPKGTPRVDLAALVELKRLLMCAAETTHSWGDSRILRENHHDASQAAVADRVSADESAVRRQKRKHSVRTAGSSGQAASLAALGFQFHGRSWSIR
jgi:hypothetical protein